MKKLVGSCVKNLTKTWQWMMKNTHFSKFKKWVIIADVLECTQLEQDS